MTPDWDDLPTHQGKRRISGSDREKRVVRRQGALSRIAHPLLRFLRSRVGRPWQLLQAELDARLLRLPANRFLRQRVRQMLVRTLA